jgi:hypothetical protein
MPRSVVGGLWELLTGTPVGLVVLAVGALAATFAYHDWATRDRGSGGEGLTGRVRVGMHFSEVGRSLDTGPPPKPSYPRMRQHFPTDEFGDGVLNYQGQGLKLRVVFLGGYVTSVEEALVPDAPGSYRYDFRMTERTP